MLAMSRWLASLEKWCHLAGQGGFTDLDIQIDKLRTLRDSYQAPPQDIRHDMIADVNKDRLCC